MNGAHPGTYIRVGLSARGLSQREFASALGVSEQYMSDIICGRRGISVKVALRLEEVTNLFAETWLNRQMRYDLARERAKEQG